MAIEKMRLVKIQGNNENLDETVTAIGKCDCFQPENASKVFSSSLGFLPYSEDNPYEQMLTDLSVLMSKNNHQLNFNDEYAFEDLTDEDTKHIEELYKKIEDLKERRSSLIEQKNKCEEGIQKFSHFIGLSVDLDDILELEYVRVRFGHMPKDSIHKLDSIFERCPYFYFIPCSTDKTDYWGAYFAPRNRVDEADSIFAMLLFERLEIPGAVGTVENIIKELENNLKIISQQLGEINTESKQLLESEAEFVDRAFSKFTVLNNSVHLKSYTIHNGHYFMLAGWIPKQSEKSFTDALQDIPSLSLEITKPHEEKLSPPVKIKSIPKPFKYLVDPYRFYIDMYGTPAYSDIDITPFVAITYTILFGIMFGDMGQGFVLSLVGFLMFKLKKMELGKILVPCGISSMFFGFMFGSVFGYEHMLDKVYYALGWQGKPLEVMENVNTVLLLSIGIGIGLTALSILLNIYALVKQKKFGEALFSQNGITGLLVYLAGVNFASGFMGGPAPISNKSSYIIIGIGAVILIFKEIPIGIIDRHPNWKPDSIMDFILQNIFELLEYILSYLSNTVSFLRVGAFVLVHAGMMMVVFSLAGESQNLFVIILGNILVIALEGLLTGIQALRLEYYEMFSRFYKGGGKAFNAFSSKKLSIGGIQK